MIDITQLRVVRPHEVGPGTLLLGGAHYSDPPAFVFAFNDQAFWFECSGRKPFNGFPMVNNLHPHLLAGSPTLIVDVDTKISPTRSDIPAGSAVLIADQPAIAISINYGTAYVGLDGQMLPDPRSYDNLVAFGRWKFVVPAFGNDQWLTIHEAGVDVGG